jgi:UDP-N-acetylmuramoyl-L-alanyl-D-glutamate--2,6-diaminopimelate ligase
MRLDRLLNDVDVFDRPADARKVDVTKLTEDISDVTPGSLFFCVVGSTRDGHDFADEAVQKGAVAIVVDREIESAAPQIRVSNVRAAIAPIAAVFNDYPSKRLRMVGITGTNGKTTTSHLLAEILRRHRWKTAVLGTLMGKFTTPPAIELQQMLATLRDEEHNAVVMEVSSSALAQNRVDVIRYDAAVFTNLTQDHLDYHKTMAKYFEAKSMLFDPGRSEVGVINMDDPYGRQLCDRLAIPLEPYSLNDARELRSGEQGSSFVWQDQQIHLPLIGEFNVYNALAAATTAKAMGVSTTVIAQTLNEATQIPGRMEMVRRGQPFAVVVDFAHTPDSLRNVLTVARNVASGRRVLVVFGCGGDRDRDKRPQMGAIAEEFADDVVVTTDNSRSEEPAEIVNEILGGMTDSSKAHVYLDRAVAIHQAIGHANQGDVVVIAGKGHEATQEVKGVKTPFDDRLVAAEAADRWVARNQ